MGFLKRIICLCLLHAHSEGTDYIIHVIVTTCTRSASKLTSIIRSHWATNHATCRLYGL